MYQFSAAMSQQQRQVLPEHNGGDLKTNFPAFPAPWYGSCERTTL